MKLCPHPASLSLPRRATAKVPGRAPSVPMGLLPFFISGSPVPDMGRPDDASPPRSGRGGLTSGRWTASWNEDGRKTGVVERRAGTRQPVNPFIPRSTEPRIDVVRAWTLGRTASPASTCSVTPHGSGKSAPPGAAIDPVDVCSTTPTVPASIPVFGSGATDSIVVGALTHHLSPFRLRDPPRPSTPSARLGGGQGT
jgi:hypothetical protein